MTDLRLGVVLVTHNSSPWISSTLNSISAQTLPPTRVVVIDDLSVDDTRNLVDEWASSSMDPSASLEWVASTATDQHSWTRIARNFTQGVRALADMDLVALGDHDDIWLPRRLQAQSELMSETDAMFLASNGVLQDSELTLFEVFGVPADAGVWGARTLLRHLLRFSVATGGASMIRPSALLASAHFAPPPRWLHDRWWSLLAASQGRLLVSQEPVIRYRLSPEQSVGLDRGRQGRRGLDRLASIRVADFTRLKNVHSLKSEAAPELRGEFVWGRLLRTML